VINRLSNLADTIDNFQKALNANDQSKMIQLKAEFDAQVVMFATRLLPGWSEEFESSLTERLDRASGVDAVASRFKDRTRDYKDREKLSLELDEVLGHLRGAIKALKLARPLLTERSVKKARSKSKARKKVK